ncbi:MAG: desulfoferrodoxin [Erysipelotrichaceae bacterium]|nr:desulfoferrodoxin [Erysipelotrichaceae bacterium]
MEHKFFKCSNCGKIVMELNSIKTNSVCCGVDMQEIIPGTVEASKEKHIPVYKLTGDRVDVMVGEVEHPMIDVHYIEWIAVETNRGIQIKYLKPGDEPKASFSLVFGELINSVYAYCNIHGLWKC